MERATVVFRDKLSYDEARKELHSNYIKYFENIKY